MQAAAMEIGGMLKDWHVEKCQKGNLSWSNLAKKAGISASYLSKLASGVIKLPSYEKGKSIYKALRPNDVEGLYAYLVANFPTKTPPYQSFFESELKAISPESANHFSDPITFRLMKLALGESYSREALLDMFCTKDLEIRLQKLEEDGIIRFNEDKIMCRGDGHKRTLSTEKGNVANQFEHCLAMLIKKKSENELHDVPYDSVINAMAYYHDSLNDKGTAKMAELVAEYIQSTRKVLRNPEYKGNVPVFLNLMTGRFDQK